MKKSQDALNGRTYAGEVQAERQAKRHQKFIEAGHELFGTIGFRQTTVRVICKQAELTDRYFYESFSSMEDVLVVVYEQAIREIQSKILGAIQNNDYKDDVDALIRQVLDIFFQSVECPKTARIIWLEVLGVSPRVDLIYNHAIRSFAALFLQLSLSVYPNIQLSNAERDVVAIGIVGAISQSTMAWLLNGYQLDRQIMVSSMFHIIKGTSSQLIFNSQ